MSDWIDAVIEDIALGRDPLEAVAHVELEDPREKWYCRAVQMLLSARNDPDNDPGRVLHTFRDLGYPLHDILHVAMLYQTLLIAIAVNSVLDIALTEDEISSGAEKLISQVEDYLKTT